MTGHRRAACPGTASQARFTGRPRVSARPVRRSRPGRSTIDLAHRAALASALEQTPTWVPQMVLSGLTPVFRRLPVCSWWCPVAAGGTLGSVFQAASATACW
jgi:hypothetical protein